MEQHAYNAHLPYAIPSAEPASRLRPVVSTLVTAASADVISDWPALGRACTKLSALLDLKDNSLSDAAPRRELCIALFDLALRTDRNAPLSTQTRLLHTLSRLLSKPLKYGALERDGSVVVAYI